MLSDCPNLAAPFPLVPPSLPAGGGSHQVVRYWSFSVSVSPSSEYSGLISFRMDWLDLAVQGTLKSLLQHVFTVGSVCLHFSAPFSPHTTAALHGVHGVSGSPEP